jgi:hypothetical protein
MPRMRPTLLLVVAMISYTAAPAAAACRAVAGGDAVVPARARVIFGEMHGTQETPRLVADVACAAAARGPLRVGLEIPADEQPRLDRFLASAGGSADRAALLEGPFWHRALQDGRSSTGMLSLLDALRALKKQSRDVRVVAFDVASTQKVDGRDRAMAATLAAAFRKEPQAAFVVLVGNLHARKAEHPQFKQRFMAQYLVDEEKTPVTTIDVRPSLGSAWVCTPSCGAQTVGRGGATPVAIAPTPTPDKAYDGTASVGAASFAPPAARPLTADEKKQAERLPLVLDARRACDAGDHAGCAATSLTLAEKDPAAAANYLYNAACSYAQLDDADHAFAVLGSAVDHGFSDGAWLQKDTDLASLHADARWAPLVARVGAAKKK